MKIATGMLVLPALLMLVSCAGAGSASSGWTHAGLDEGRRQQEIDKCTVQAKAAEDAYYEQNAKLGTNSSTSLINNLKVRQTGMRLRNEAQVECLLAAGFTQQQ